MDLNNVYALAVLLAALSMASERLVEIVKGVFPSLSLERKTLRGERRRKSLLQAIAVAAGMFTTFLIDPVLSGIPDSWAFKCCLGLVASGGSGFWNSVLGYVAQAKEAKRVEAQR